MSSNRKSDSKYSAPKLVVYGDMASLTASGVGSKTETPSGMTGKKP
jgi:hypothetical protein